LVKRFSKECDLLASGILWHLGAALMCFWFGYQFIAVKSQRDEWKEALLPLLSWPDSAGLPSRSLVLRALRICEKEARDVFGTSIQWVLQMPPPECAREAVAAFWQALQRDSNFLQEMAQSVGEGKQRLLSYDPTLKQWTRMMKESKANDGSSL
jgi:hypothetical protein